MRKFRLYISSTLKQVFVAADMQRFMTLAKVYNIGLDKLCRFFSCPAIIRILQSFTYYSFYLTYYSQFLMVETT